MINGEFVDGYAPKTDNPHSALESGLDKVREDGQAQRVDIVLDRTSITIEDMQDALVARSEKLDGIEFAKTVEIDGVEVFVQRPLEEVTVLKDGERVVLWTRGG